QEATRDNLDGLRCHLCTQIADADISLPTYATVATLSRHITSSTRAKLVAIERGHDWWNDAGLHPSRLAVSHDDAKRANGCYDDDFRGDKESKRKRQLEDNTQSYRRQSELNKALKFSNDKELSRPIPLPSDKYPGLCKGLRLGTERSLDIPKELANGFIFGDPLYKLAPLFFGHPYFSAIFFNLYILP
ncbi:hypothetical protein FZEAL_10887, partial [Fusarium zealandicum]